MEHGGRTNVVLVAEIPLVSVEAIASLLVVGADVDAVVVGQAGDVEETSHVGAVEGGASSLVGDVQGAAVVQ